MLAENQTFTERTIVLDGGTFYKCRFIRCKLVVYGALPVAFDGLRIEDCEWDFQGHAAYTLGFLKMLNNAGASEAVDLIIGGIRAKS